MPRYYKLATDVARKLLCIEFEREFWDRDVADRFKADVAEAVASLHCAAGQHLVLVDLRNAVLQSQDVFERLQMLAGSSVARRIALVASTPLARMQTKRLQIRDNIVMFADMAEAKEWLIDGAERSAA